MLLTVMTIDHVLTHAPCHAHTEQRVQSCLHTELLVEPRDINVITPHAWVRTGAGENYFPQVSLHECEGYLTRQVTPLEDQNQAFLPGIACLPSLQGDSGFLGVRVLGFPKSHRRNHVSLGQDLPSLLPSWNSPGAAGRAQNLKPKIPRFAQTSPHHPVTSSATWQQVPSAPENRNLANLGASSELSV